MNENEKFESFIASILERSQSKADQLVKDAEQESRDILEEARQAASQAADRHIRDSRKMDAGKTMRAMSAAENELRRAEHSAREQLTDEMFAKITDRLIAYTATKEYEESLAAAIAAEDTSGAEIRVSPRDAALIGSAAIPDSDIRIGGYMIIRRNEGICINNTFDLALESERESFSSRDIS